MERDCESELSKLNIEQNACIYHFGASVIHGQRSNILRLRIYNNNQENLKLYHLGYQKRLRIFKLQPSFFSNFSNFIILSTLRYHIYSFYLPNILNIFGSMPSHSLTCLIRTDKTQYCRKITNLIIYNANNT